MTTTTFDPTDEPNAAQQEAEARAMAQGEQLQKLQQQAKERDLNQLADENADIQLIDGKFRSTDDLLKAYKELEKKLGAPQTDQPEDAQDDQPRESDAPEDDQRTEPDEAFDYMVELGKQYDQDGQLSEEAVAKLSQMDSKQLIESYLKYYQQTSAQAQQAQLQESQIQQIKNSVGGEDSYNELINWAAANLPQEQIDQFNEVTNSGNAAAISFAVESLNNRFRGDVGYEADLVSGKSAGSGVKPYRSQAELARDIANPLYSQDPAFRQDVEARLSVSRDLL